MPKKRDHGQGGLYYLPKRDLWRGVVDLGYDRDGKRRQKYVHARTKSECAAKLKTLIGEIDEHGAPLDKQTTVREWADRWLGTVAKVDVDPKTYGSYASLSRRWIVPVLGRKKVSALTPADVRALRAALMGEGRSTSLARQAHIVLRRMLADARREGLCGRNVAEDVDMVRLVQQPRRALTTTEALAVLRAATALPAWSGSRWWFQLLAGQRQGEIVGATLADLDLETGTYAVQWKLEELVREHGCGGTCTVKRGAACPQARWRVPDGFEMRQLDGRVHLTRPKSRADRVVPLIPQMSEAIGRHIAATEGWPNPHGLIWRNPDGSPILAKQDAQEWKDLLRSAGVISAAEAVPGGTGLTGHTARHTTVTILASLGVDFQVIGEIVGHSSAQVTRLYRHTQDAEKRAAMEALGGVWAEGLALPGGGIQGRWQTPIR